MDIRNIAIIAHVDHGKTTLVDALLTQGGAFSAHQEVEELAMDSNELEKERGITIYSKPASIMYEGTKINIVDTPGHADFGSEVERILRTVGCVLLLVDAYEGPMPQTRFVLKKSLELGLKPIVLLNKIDKPMARPDEVLNMVFDLFAELGADDEQLDFPYLYTIGKDGIAKKTLDDDATDLSALFDLVMEKVPLANGNEDQPLRFQPSNLDYDNYLGRLAVGRVFDGVVKAGQQVLIKNAKGELRRGKVSKLMVYQGMSRVEVQEASAGDICVLAGMPDIFVGETICMDEGAEPLPDIAVDPPTISMTFLVNSSPFAGREGKFVTTRHIKDRLDRELETNVGLQVEQVEGQDAYKVSGRGEMHIAVLVEQMRREGFELSVSKPQVLMQDTEEGRMEPCEYAVVEVPDDFAGTVIEKLGKRKGTMKNMQTENGVTRMEYEIPTRGLLGFRSEFIVDTKGNGILTHSFLKYVPYQGEIQGRNVGSMISGVQGTTLAYSLWNLQDRGPLFVGPQTDVYEGMIIGEHLKGDDLVVNPTKGKQLTNVRASGSDDAVTLTPHKKMTLEEALEYIEDDEYVEVTPENIRLRKKWLTENERKRNRKG